MRHIGSLVILTALTACASAEPLAPYSAQPWDAANACWGASVELDVLNDNVDGCDDVLSTRADATGDCWLFPQACNPSTDGWGPCTDGSVDMDAELCD
ncbi:MAG: hypothetical protein AB8H79_04235 [Myxococcota bacterium]